VAEQILGVDVDPISFGRLIVNRTGRYNGLGHREPDDEHRLVARYQAPVEMRLAERRRVERSDEDEIEATGDVILDEYLRRHRRDF
jgi:hypothetical protein